MLSVQKRVPVVFSVWGKKHSDVFVQSIDFDFDRLERKLIIDFFRKEEMNLFLISSLEEREEEEEEKRARVLFLLSKIGFRTKNASEVELNQFQKSGKWLWRSGQSCRSRHRRSEVNIPCFYALH